MNDRNQKLKQALETLNHRSAVGRRLEADPILFPHLYDNPRDVEVSALLSCSLAYGRVSLFQPKIKHLLDGMGKSPSAFIADLTLKSASTLLKDFVYRFNVATDLAVLLFGMSRALRTYGSLEKLFLKDWGKNPSIRHALNEFTLFLRSVEMAPLRRTFGPERGIGHLLPSSLGGGASKRLNLFLRWMVRGPDPVDFGIWRGVRSSSLIIPLDTHIGRLSRHLGLTRRRDLSWRTAEEITDSLRKIDPDDPVRFDFALCHHGMSGECPLVSERTHCERCPLLNSCRTGKRLLTAKGMFAR